MGTHHTGEDNLRWMEFALQGKPHTPIPLDVQMSQAQHLCFDGVACLPPEGGADVWLDPIAHADLLPSGESDILSALKSYQISTWSVSVLMGLPEPPWKKLFRKMAAYGMTNLLLAVGVGCQEGLAERGARLIERLEKGEKLSGDEALAEVRRQVLLQEADWEKLARVLHTIRRIAGPRLRISLFPGANPGGILQGNALETLLQEPEFAGIGYWHDTGVAQIRHAFGLEEPGWWLDTFGASIQGTTLQDWSVGTTGLAPGEGEVDFRLVAEYLPAEARRVLSLAPSYSGAALTEAADVFATLRLG